MSDQSEFLGVVMKHGVFWHKCEEDGCDNDVQYDDEPKCFTHSPDEGSSVRGYSAYAKWVQAAADLARAQVVHNLDKDQRAVRRTIKLEVRFENVTEVNAEGLETYLKHLMRLGVEREGGIRIEVESVV